MLITKYKHKGKEVEWKTNLEEPNVGIVNVLIVS